MMIKEEVFVTNSPKETQKLGEHFARRSRVSALYGDLGSGKTTFVQGMAKGLGIERRIISPTFVIIRSYNLKTTRLADSPRFAGEAGALAKRATQNSKLFYHIDLYRIKNERDITGLGLEEIMNDPQNIVAIEWAEKMSTLLPKERWDVKLEYLGEEKRRIIIKKFEYQNSKSEIISKFK